MFFVCFSFDEIRDKFWWEVFLIDRVFFVFVVICIFSDVVVNIFI